MPPQKQTANDTAHQQAQSKRKPDPEAGQVEQSPLAAPWTGAFGRNGDPYADALQNGRIPLSQRQALATEIGRVNGNQMLQRVIEQVEGAAEPREGEPGAAGPRGGNPLGAAALNGDPAAAQLMRMSAPPGIIQRQDPPTTAPAKVEPTWNAPFELGPIKDRGAARTAMNIVIENLATLKSSLDDAGAASIDASIKTLQGHRDALSGNDPLSAREATDLNIVGNLAEQTYNTKLDGIKAAVLAFVQSIKLPDTSEADSSFADALHAAFVNGEGDDKVASIKEAIGKLKEYNGNCKDVLEWGQKAADAVKLVKTAESLKKYVDGLGKVDSLIGKVQKVISTAEQFATLAGFQKEKAGAMQQSIQQFRAGMELASAAMTLFKSVPLVGQYWSNFIMPLTDACLKGLEKLSGIAEKIGLESILDAEPGPGGAPIIPKLQVQYFPGGQPVLDFMFQLVNGGSPTVTPAVEEYFLKFRKQFNAGQSSDEQLEVDSTTHWYNPLTWFDKDKTANLMEWAQRNKDTIWAQLYGSLPHNLKR